MKVTEYSPERSENVAAEVVRCTMFGTANASDGLRWVDLRVRERCDHSVTVTVRTQSAA